MGVAAVKTLANRQQASWATRPVITPLPQPARRRFFPHTHTTTTIEEVIMKPFKSPDSARAPACSLLIAVLLTACGGDSAPAPVPAPPINNPPVPPPVTVVGAVYAGTNSNGPAGNWVVGFRRKSDGTLEPIDIYDTGGVGRASLSSTPPRLNSLIAEDSIIAVDDRYLIVVNAGSNDVSSLRINPDLSLTRVDVEPSGGTSPISLAYRNGVVYVANADEDGVFTAPPNQSGNITAMRLDLATGQLERIAGFSLSLRGRPSDLEVTPDGVFLLASSLNAGAPQLPQPTAREVSSFRIQANGTLASVASGTGASTELNNAAGRNLPNAIGIETYSALGRQFVIAAEARTASSTGAPATSFAALQTGSVSTWEILADGTLLPRSQDFLLGPSTTSGPMQAGFLAYSPVYSTFWVATSAGATISGYGLNDDGSIARGERLVSGRAADAAAASPLAEADGYVDLALSPDGRWLYQLVGLQGRIDVYEVDTLVAWNIARRQQVATSLLPRDNLQGLVVVGVPPR
jgi:6-phosphogluconolactonase (cycloisomerase 2 family)